MATAIPSPRESYTTFPQSIALSAAPSSPEDNTFSILPRYFLQKVRDTFAAGPVQGDLVRKSYDGAPRSRQTSNDRPASIRRAHRASIDSVSGRRPSSPALSSRHPHLASIQESSRPPSSVGSRSPRLSTASLSRRSTAQPVLTADTLSIASGQMTVNPAAQILARSHSSMSNALVDGEGPASPPPPYTSARASFVERIPEDARSSSSVGSLAVAQVFKKLQGDPLNRDFWWACCVACLLEDR